ncbi:MAG TPA: serine hydrolase, partial [Candidatus Elarobacter sp.]|nr:serine hydrolase [Candidatus Elarobacter sp.]
AAPADASDVQRALDARVAGMPGVGIVMGVLDGTTRTIYTAGSTGTRAPLDEHTEFEIGSVTKTFTATVLASMVLDHTVSLDDPVAKYLPPSVHVPSRDGKAITLLNLATQHSGLPRIPANLDAEAADPYAHYTTQDLYTFLGSYALTRDPGASFEYSNLGVGLLGVALANAAHTPYPALVRERVLAPLGMSATAVGVPDAMRARLAAPHTTEGDAAHNWTFDALAPAGGIVSNVDDMLKYVRCNMGLGPLAATCTFAQQPRDTIPGQRIGLVWWTGNVHPIVHHGGDTQGYHAAVAIAPDRSRGVVVLSNGGTGVEDIALHAIDASIPIVPPEPPERNDPALLDTYAGTYVYRDGTKYVFTRRGGQLYAQLGDQEIARVYAAGQDRFVYHIVDAQLQFTHDAQGKVNAVVLRQNGQTSVWVKPGMTPPTVIPGPSFPPVVPLDAATLAAYAGTYAAGNGLQFVVRRADPGIEVQLTGQTFIPVYASAKDHFYYRVVDAQIDFVRDANGRVQSLVLHQNGQTITATKQ